MVEDNSRTNSATTSLAIIAFAGALLLLNNFTLNQKEVIYYISGLLLIMGYLVGLVYLLATDAPNGAKRTIALITAVASAVIIIIMIYPMPTPSSGVANAITNTAGYLLFTNILLMIGASFAKKIFRLQF